MKKVKQIVSILFSDVKGYSKIQDDDLYLKLKTFNDEIENNILNNENHFFVKTWGDAFFICSYDPIDMANIALDIRDKFKNTNWKRLGFLENLKVRIGLHTEKVNVVSENNKVKDVIGHNINSTARIEPIVEPNHVYCSEFFHKHLEKEKNINFAFRCLGNKKLAKDFGEESLYELLRDYEFQKKENDQLKKEYLEIPEIKVKKKVSQKELNDYLRETFSFIAQYFEYAIQQLQKSNPEIEISLIKSENNFNAEMYVNGEYKTECRIWYGDEFGSKQIFYSEGKSFGQTSYNECIYVENDGFETFFKPMMGFQFGQINKEKILKPEKVAEYLWLRFTQPLTY